MLWGCGDVGVADDGMYCMVVALGEARREGVLCVGGRYGTCLAECTEILSVGGICVAEVRARSLPVTRWALMKIPSMREREMLTPC